MGGWKYGCCKGLIIAPWWSRLLLIASNSDCFKCIMIASDCLLLFAAVCCMVVKDSSWTIKGDSTARTPKPSAKLAPTKGAVGSGFCPREPGSSSARLTAGSTPRALKMTKKRVLREAGSARALAMSWLSAESAENETSPGL